MSKHVKRVHAVATPRDGQVSLTSEMIPSHEMLFAKVLNDSRTSLDSGSANTSGVVSWNRGGSTGFDRPGQDRQGKDRLGIDRSGTELRGVDKPGFELPSRQEPWIGVDRMGLDRPGFDQPRWSESVGESSASGGNFWGPQSIVQDYGHGRSIVSQDDLGEGGMNTNRPGQGSRLGIGGGDGRDMGRSSWGRGDTRPVGLGMDREGIGMVGRENFGGTGNMGGFGEMGSGAGVMSGSRERAGPGAIGGSGDQSFGGNGSWLPPPQQPGRNQYMPFMPR